MLLGSRPRPASPTYIRGYVDSLLRALQAVHTSRDDIDAELGKIQGFLREDKPFFYVNYACELALASHFKTIFPDQFAYQVPTPFAETPTGTQLTFDFKFHVDEMQYNVEVKNFSRSWTAKDTQLPIKLFLPQDQANAMFALGLRPEGTSRPALGEFLVKANDQLFRPLKGKSVVFVCCNDVEEYADALECLEGTHGIARDERRVKQLPNIDVVIVCKLGLFHHAALDTDAIKKLFRDGQGAISDQFDAWQYENIFAYAIVLPREGEASESKIGTDFVRTFHLTNGNLQRYKNMHPGNLQGAVFERFNASLQCS